MKRVFAFLSFLLFLTSTATADTGIRKDVKNVKDVKTHAAEREVQSMEKTVTKTTTTTRDDGDSIQFVKNVMPPQQQAAPARQSSQSSATTVTTTETKTETKKTRKKKDVCKLTEMTYSENYGTQFLGHWGRGFLNVLSGWVELPRQAYKETMEGPPVVGIFTGIVSGAVHTVLRTASGVLDIPSGLIPHYTSELYYHNEPTIGCLMNQ